MNPKIVKLLEAKEKILDFRVSRLTEEYDNRAASFAEIEEAKLALLDVQVELEREKERHENPSNHSLVIDLAKFGSG